MKKTGTTITVTAKGDFGYHPGLKLDIVKDREYTIDESEFAEQLFNRPAPDWKSPAERETEAKPAAVSPVAETPETPAAEAEPAAAKKAKP